MLAEVPPSGEDEVHLDLIGKITPKTCHKEQYYLFAMDDKSELIKVLLERTMESDETRLSFLTPFPKNDRPETLILDNGTEFMGSDNSDLLAGLGCKIWYTPAYNSPSA